MSEDAWEGADGVEYGGQSDILTMSEGEMAGPLTYAGANQVTTDLGETTSHVAIMHNGEQIRLPIQATFIRAMDMANLQQGDTFAVRRDPDQIKKRGKGAGNAMAIFRIKVLSRAAASAA